MGRNNIAPIFCVVLFLPIFVLGMYAVTHQQKVSDSDRLLSRLNANPESDVSTILVDQSSNDITPLLINDGVVNKSQRSFVLIHREYARGWTNAFDLYDINQTTPELVYQVRGPSWYTFNFNPQDGNVSHLTLNEMLWSTTSTYTVEGTSQELGTIKNQFFSWADVYNIELETGHDNGNDTTATQYQLKSGNLWGNVYWMRNANDEIVAKLSYHYGFFLSTYLQIHVAPGMDQSCVWACAVAQFNDQIKAQEAAADSSSSTSKSKGKKKRRFRRALSVGDPTE